MNRQDHELMGKEIYARWAKLNEASYEGCSIWLLTDCMLEIWQSDCGLMVSPSLPHERILLIKEGHRRHHEEGHERHNSFGGTNGLWRISTCNAEIKTGR